MNHALLMHNDSLQEHNRQFTANVITVDNLVSMNKIHIPSVQMPGGDKDDFFDFWGWEFEKNGIKYLLPDTNKEGEEYKIKDVLPFKITKSETVAHKGKVYTHIREFNKWKFRPLQHMSFETLVKTLSTAPHTNHKQREILIIIALASIYTRTYYRISSNPGFGKDSIVDTMNLLVGGCATVSEPSTAKLEWGAAFLRWLGVNEVVGLTPAEFNKINKFILDACAYKPTITKRTRSFGSIGEIIDMNNFSMCILYNDIDCYKDKNIKYFDELAEAGVIDRLPALRMNGVFTYNFDEIYSVDLPSFVTEHMDFYRSLFETIEYYKEEYTKTLPPSYNFGSVSNRWKRSLIQLQKGLWLMSGKDKKVYDSYCEEVNNMMVDYEAMLQYNVFVERFENKCHDLEVRNMVMEKVKTMNTFIEKISYLDKASTGRLEVNNVNWEQW